MTPPPRMTPVNVAVSGATGQHPTNRGQRFPMRAFVAGALFTLAPFAIGNWAVLSLDTGYQRLASRELRLEQLNGVIARLDEVLTMSALAAAATGDMNWETRYRRYEPELDSSIKAAITISPLASTARGTLAADSANARLVAMEHAVFALLRNGKRDEASKLIGSSEYARQKAIYSAGMELTMSQARGDVRLQKEHFSRLTSTVLLIQLCLLVPLSLCWLRIQVLIRRYIKARDKAELASRDLNESLEARVVERTALLSAANEKVHCEMEARLASERDLRQSQKLKAVGSLAAGIAHEINTPIQFVGDNVRFLSDSFAEIDRMLERTGELVNALAAHPELAVRVREFVEAQQAADIDYIQTEVPKAVAQTLGGVARVAKIVQAMKDFSHPDQGQKGAADLNRALDSTLTVANSELKYVADVVTDFDDSLPSVRCHLGDLNQVFLNLLVNAAHAIAGVVGDGSSGKGTITVTTRSAESTTEPGTIDGVVVSVADTGTGIPEAIRDRVFEQFFTTKEVGRGTGQGLAIAHAVVVEKHGGRIWFTTEAGQGTTFHVYLPIGVEEMVEAR